MPGLPRCQPPGTVGAADPCARRSARTRTSSRRTRHFWGTFTSLRPRLARELGLADGYRLVLNSGSHAGRRYLTCTCTCWVGEG